MNLRRSVESIGEYILMVAESFAVIFRRPPSWHLLRDQLYEVGVASTLVVAITGFSTGMVLAAQTIFHLQDKGFAEATGLLVTKSMMVELGPILTAFMVTGRVGAAMCAEIGTMKVTEQIDALKSMSVNPMSYLIAPRVIAGIFMLPLLTIFSAITGVIGGFIIAVYVFNMTPISFLDPLHSYIRNFDFIMGLIKGLVFGFIFVTISCYKGLTTKGGAAGVGRSTTQSVVICYIVILIVNFFLTVGMNNIYTYSTEGMHAFF